MSIVRNVNCCAFEHNWGSWCGRNIFSSSFLSCAAGQCGRYEMTTVFALGEGFIKE